MLNMGANMKFKGDLFKKGNIWQMRIYTPGGQKLLRSCRTSDEAEAKDILKKKLQNYEWKLANGKFFIRKKGFYEKDRIWYYSYYDEKKNKIAKSTGKKSYEEALEYFRQEIEPNLPKNRKYSRKINGKIYYYQSNDKLRKIWIQYIERLVLDKSSWIWRLWHHIKERQYHSKKRNRVIEANLEFEDLLDLMLSTNGRCQVSGIPFSDYKPPDSRSSPYIPSIDRIDPKIGYVKGNCRIVCFCVNLAMNEWGDEVIEMIGMSFIYKKLVSDYFDKIDFKDSLGFDFELPDF